MADIAIRVRNLGKQYFIGEQQERYKTLRDSLNSMALRPIRALKSLATLNKASPAPDRSIWAIKDISFEVDRGEVVGIIGRNGAGKSTLLKILSRITEPTHGYADIHGRVGSLLEVGTGFHPELSGRENIFLNGTILGMKKSDIEKRFDEIVAFAEVERFVDTPVKHYSSGMYLRLAFAVAAHLEPEILVIDEVLAVGDAAFQRKCLGKMGEVAQEGRTVLFVSHNMAAVKALCSRTILLNGGQVTYQGSPEATISKYLSRDQSEDMDRLSDRGGSGPIRFTEFILRDSFGQECEVVQSGESILIELKYNDRGLYESGNPIVFQIFFSTITGDRIFTCSTRFTENHFGHIPSSGCIRCVIPKFPLVPGTYIMDIVCKADRDIMDHVWSAKTLTVIEGDFFGSGRLPPASSGPVLVKHSWELSEKVGLNC